jgi:hypothetical protein
MAASSRWPHPHPGSRAVVPASLVGGVTGAGGVSGAPAAAARAARHTATSTPASARPAVSTSSRGVASAPRPSGHRSVASSIGGSTIAAMVNARISGAPPRPRKARRAATPAARQRTSQSASVASPVSDAGRRRLTAPTPRSAQNWASSARLYPGADSS